MKKILKYLLYTLFLPFWYLELLIPRDKRIWLFGAWFGKKYCDNSAVFYEFTRSNPDINAIWITKSKDVYRKNKAKGLDVYMASSIKGIWFSLIAGKVFYSNSKKDVNNYFINGATLINIWHGSPMKKIGLDDKFASLLSVKNFVLKHLFPFIWEFKFHYLISSSEFFNKNFCSAFDIEESSILTTGYPRCDLLFEEREYRLIKSWNKKYSNPKKILYLPTFRSLAEGFRPFELFGFDSDQWSNYLSANNSILISKGHFVDDNVGDDSLSGRIIHLSDKDVSDINNLLRSINLLVTDYSSVYFDFLLKDKPVVLAPFDIKEYLSNSREFYYDYEEISCGYIVNTWSQLLELLKEHEIESLKDEKLFEEKKQLFNKYQDNKNSQRLMDAITKI